MRGVSGSFPIILKASGAITANGTGSAIVIPSGFTRAKFVLSVTAASGTSPTLDVYIQTGIKFPASGDVTPGPMTGTLTWNDWAHFGQMTGTGTRYAEATETGGFEGAAQDAALAAGSIRAGVIGTQLRVKYVLAATTPSFTFSVFGELLP